MPYRWVVGDLRTGKINRTVDPLNPSWSAGFNGTDSLTIEIPGRARKAAQDPGSDGAGTVMAWPTVRADTAPAKSYLAVAWVNSRGEETWITGGPIWSRNRKRSDGVITVGAAGLWSYWDHRKLLPVLTAGADVAKLTSAWTGAQLGLIAKRMLQQAQAETSGQVPLVLPSDAALGGAGTTHERNYPGHQLAYVGERLRQLTQVEKGPEIQFVPRRRSDDPRCLEWVARIGVAPSMALMQSGDPWVIDDTVPNTPVLDISTSEDGNGLGTRAFAAGQGQGEGRPIRFKSSTALTSVGYPLLDVEMSRTDNVSQTGTLDAYAGDLLARSARPIETTSIDFALSEYWRRYWPVRPGDVGVLKVHDDGWDTSEPQDVRFLSISGGKTDKVTVACMSREGRL